MTRWIFVLMSVVLCAPAAWAQQMSVPTELQEQTARALAAEKQNEYLMIHIQRLAQANAQRAQAEAEESRRTAMWWSEVWKALVERAE